MYNNYNNSPNLMISIGSIVSSQQKTSSIKLPNFFKTCSCSIVNSQTNFDDVSMYLKFGHKSITLSKNFTLIFSYKGQSTTKWNICIRWETDRQKCSPKTLIGSVIVSVLASNAVDRGFESRSGQTMFCTHILPSSTFCWKFMI